MPRRDRPINRGSMLKKMVSGWSARLGADGPMRAEWGLKVRVQDCFRSWTNLSQTWCKAVTWVWDPLSGPGDITAQCLIAWQLSRSSHSARTALRKKVDRSIHVWIDLSMSVARHMLSVYSICAHRIPRIRGVPCMRRGSPFSMGSTVRDDPRRSGYLQDEFYAAPGTDPTLV